MILFRKTAVMKMRIESLLEEKIMALPESRVRDAMAYSLLAGGKRIRPLLLYAAVKGYGKEESLADEFACAIEMIHTYSLIHDELPAMDNDDLRRGRPTCHKQFDEATAILAGDGLLTYAFEVAASAKCGGEEKAAGMKYLAEMAGPSGMVLGQCLDIFEEQGKTSWDDVQTIQKYKTGCLLSVPMMIGSVLAGHPEDAEKWHRIGDMIGLAFQIQDDILDVRLTPEEFGKSTSDSDNEKVTCVSIYGIETAERMMNSLYDEAIRLVLSFGAFDAAGIIAMIEQIRGRTM